MILLDILGLIKKERNNDIDRAANYLREIRVNIILGKENVTKYEMAINMITDLIEEVEKRRI